MELLVCVGSACHLRGAHQVLEECTRLIREFDLESSLQLRAGFCQGRCTDGVNLLIDGESIGGVFPGNVHEIFNSVILPLLKKGAGK
jgi:NADH:ubiquinone oxidoreductase subunit E